MSNKPPILLLSPPNQGKSTGLKFINEELAKRTLYINCDKKALPWIGNKHFVQRTAACPTHIPALLKKANESGKFDLIVVDTITIGMSEYRRRYIDSTYPKYETNDAGEIITDTNYVSISEKNGGTIDSMGGWGRYGALALDIADASKSSDAQVIIMGHLSSKQDEESGDFIYKCPLAGAVGAQGYEGQFSLVMHAKSMTLRDLEGYDQDHEFLTMEESIEFSGSRYTYQVAHTKDTIGTHDIRTIDGLWPKGVRFIDNNLQTVIDQINNVYVGDEV